MTRNPAKAACYVRSGAPNHMAITHQILHCRAEAAFDGYVIPDEYCFVADGVSGLDRNPAAWQRLLEHVQADGGSPFRHLYVTEPSRLTRDEDPRRIDYLMALLEDRGVRVHHGMRR